MAICCTVSRCKKISSFHHELTRFSKALDSARKKLDTKRWEDAHKLDNKCDTSTQNWTKDATKIWRRWPQVATKLLHSWKLVTRCRKPAQKWPQEGTKDVQKTDTKCHKIRHKMTSKLGRQKKRGINKTSWRQNQTRKEKKKSKACKKTRRQYSPASTQDRVKIKIPGRYTPRKKFNDSANWENNECLGPDCLQPPRATWKKNKGKKINKL